MKNSFQDLSNRLNGSISRFLWNQWASIGAGGHAEWRNESPSFAVDPEALVLATTRFGKNEVRLLDVANDWLTTNGRLISVQRLKNVQKATGIGEERALTCMANFMVENRFLNWKSIAADSNKASQVGFLNESREAYETRNLSQPPSPEMTASFVFRLRNFFGMSARADVVNWLLSWGPGHAALVAKETYWLPKTIQTIFLEFEEAAIGNADLVGKKMKVMSMDRNQWAQFLGGEIPQKWLNQPYFFQFCERVQTAINELAANQHRTTEFRAMKLQMRLERIGHDSRMLHLNQIFTEWRTPRNPEDLISYFEEEVEYFTSLIEDETLFSSRDFEERSNIR